MGKYRNEAEMLLEYIGGEKNIDALTHCVTRLRFVLVDPSIADIEAIEGLPTVKGTFTQAGQFQVIIGNDVDLFYNDFNELGDFATGNTQDIKAKAMKKQSLLQRASSNLGEIFSPLIPAIIVGGLILGFRNLIGDVALIELAGEKVPLVQTSTFWMGVYNFLWLIGEAIFHFLPVGITWSITKKMGTSQILGIVLGITLVSPQLLNAYAVPGAEPGSIPYWDFGFAQVNMIGYQAQVIPAMLAGFTLVYLEKFFKKIIPNAISMVFVPFFSLILAVLMAHVVLGPIGWVIGSFISDVVYAGLTSQFRVLFAGIFGFLYAPLVITGLHHMTNAIDFQLIAAFGGTLLWPMIAFSNISQGSAVLAIWYLKRKDKEIVELAIPSAISAYLGVTEPAMFGVNLKYMYAFISAMIGSAIAAMFAVGLGLMANSVGVGGLPGFLSFNFEDWGIFFAIALICTGVIPFVITILLGKRKGNE